MSAQPSIAPVSREMMRLRSENARMRALVTQLKAEILELRSARGGVAQPEMQRNIDGIHLGRIAYGVLEALAAVSPNVLSAEQIGRLAGVDGEHGKELTYQFISRLRPRMVGALSMAGLVPKRPNEIIRGVHGQGYSMDPEVAEWLLSRPETGGNHAT